MMPLYHALKAATLADSHDVDELLAIKNLDQHAVAHFDRPVAIAFTLERHLAHELHRGKIILPQVSAHGLGQPRFLHEFDQADLGRVIAVFRGGTCAA